MKTDDLSPEETSAILQSARLLAVAASQGESAKAELPDDLAKFPVSGVFVTLWEGEKLRGCVGNWLEGDCVSLGGALANATAAAVTSDRRFSPVKPDELPNLTLEVSLLHDVEPIAAELDEIEIGKHGLVIEHSKVRGLLLPSVASERAWDAETFLEQTCVKAGLPIGAWEWLDAHVTRFQATKLVSHPEL